MEALPSILCKWTPHLMCSLCCLFIHWASRELWDSWAGLEDSEFCMYKELLVCRQLWLTQILIVSSNCICSWGRKKQKMHKEELNEIRFLWLQCRVRPEFTQTVVWMPVADDASRGRTSHRTQINLTCCGSFWDFHCISFLVLMSKYLKKQLKEGYALVCSWLLPWRYGGWSTVILLHPQLGSREKGMLVLAASLLFKQSRVSTHGWY